MTQPGPGAIAGRYEAIGVVGRGGQGYVLRAVDTRHDRPVAIKVCNSPTEDDRRMLLAEARVLLGVDPHPNLPLAREDFFVEDRYCIVMDWIDGISLADLLDRAEGGYLSREAALDALEQVARAVDHLHAHAPPVMHLDIKPSNVIRRADGRFVLVDFGLSARSATPYAGGTPDYVAPEIGAGDEPTTAADVFSLAVMSYELLTGDVPVPGAEPQWRDLPTDEARRLTGVLRRGLATDPMRRPRSATELVSLLRPPPAVNNLPATMSSFVGREAEISQVKAALSTHRCVTIVGTGGGGKTRLALEAARESLATFDAVWLVELAGLVDQSGLVGHVLRAVGMREERGRDPSDALREHLRAGAQLLVLDNCEHVIDACAVLAEDVLRACPELRVLATSREPLRVTGEAVWRIPALRLPDDNTSASESEAVRLFVERAAAADPAFVVDDADVQRAVIDVCLKLDGIPLAIELAAARIGDLSIEGVRAGLEDPFATLVHGPRAVPRHETLRSAMAWSFGLLSDEEGTVLAHLSVFVGRFTADAAGAISRRDEINGSLRALVDRSLVERRARAGTDGFYLLEPIRRFALEQLELNEDPADVRGRHLGWHLELAEHARPRYQRADQAHWLTQVDASYDDMRAALGWARASSADDELRLAVALAPFWNIHGNWIEGRGVLERCCVSAPVSGLLGTALVELAGLQRLQGDTEAARASYERAAAIGEELGSDIIVIRARSGLGLLQSGRGEHASAHQVFVEQLDRARALRDPDIITDVLAALGTSSQYLGDLAAARAHFEEAEAIAGSLGDLRRLAAMRSSLGTIALVEGDIDAARASFEEARDAGSLLSDEVMVATATSMLANCASRVRDYPGARELYESSLAVFRRLGHQWRVAQTLAELSEPVMQEGDLEAGQALIEESRDVSARCGFDLIEGECLHKLSVLAHAQGRPLESVRHLGGAIRICVDHDDRLRLVLLFEHSSVLAAETGRPEDAVTMGAAAGAQRTTLGFPRSRLPVFDGALKRATGTLDAGTVSRAERRGASMSMGEASALARALCAEMERDLTDRG